MYMYIHTWLYCRRYSIGVTTGVAFCGVVGHPQRHDYTVIGQKVNMAARLMVHFPNRVTCDESTRTKSGLADSQFTLEPLEPEELKGITNPENVYTFLIERSAPHDHCSKLLYTSSYYRVYCAYSHHIMEGHHSDVHEHTDADTLIGKQHTDPYTVYHTHGSTRLYTCKGH